MSKIYLVFEDDLPLHAYENETDAIEYVRKQNLKSSVRNYYYESRYLI